MPDLEINIPKGPPETKIDKALLTALRKIDFNKERYMEAMEFAGVPAAAVTSLAMDLRYIKSGPYTHRSVTARYDQDRHQLEIDLGHGTSVSVQHELVTPWDIEEKSQWLSSNLNFSLAYHAKRIADASQRHPNTLHGARTQKSGLSRIGTLGLATTSGAIGGSQIADSIGAPVWVGGTFGAMAGMTMDLVGLYALDKINPDPLPPEGPTLHDRAFDFAHSAGARAKFDNIMTVELIPA